ncbi:crossover junction endodeoxyribonuclease RuvC [Crateriforma conspicua]|uniref:Holliday junction resolvase n=1 Tax=Crateriforma conspicua TaxID=2527996 RepID=A0A5C6FKY7_9PLAN|nr:crossover junction endodeoxyribonuclease RuvC [Crateriforma conspicua]TWU61974.1 Holliday junction resolvase [Crateriforma conspicua]
MARPRKPADSSRNKLLQVRLVDSEYESFRDAAERANLELSVWVRRHLRRAASSTLKAEEITTVSDKSFHLGIRASVKEVFWAALSGTSEAPILEDSGRIKLPKDADLPERLQCIHSQVLSIVEAVKPKTASIRLQETFIARKPAPKAFGSMLDRARIEGVLMQTLYNAGVEVWTGGLKAMRSEMGATHSLKEYLSAPDLRGIDLSAMKSEMKEAVVAGLALMEE